MDYLNTQRIVFNDNFHHELDLVFRREVVNFLPNSILYNAFNRSIRKLELEELTYNSFETTLFYLLESGASMKFVQES